jgi:L-asparaginase II
MTAVPLVRVVRSGFQESVHLGSVAVADADGRLLASAGDHGRVAFARSSMKPLQAAVSLSLIDEDLSDRQVAVMCASHSGEQVHVETVESILRRGDMDPQALRCPPARPLDPEAAMAVPEPEPRFHNCSGKHAGMLLASARRGFDVARYPEPEHPLQHEVLSAVAIAAGREPGAIGVDGCGVPVHALPLPSLATVYARLVRPERLDGFSRQAARAVRSMRAEPYLVAGKDQVCTAVMETVAGVVVKVGAEGLVCAAIEQRGIGVAVKIEDGGPRALGPAILRALSLLEALGPDQADALAGHVRPDVLGGGRPVGEMVADFELAPA